MTGLRYNIININLKIHTMKAKVENFRSTRSGREVANQFLITIGDKEIFQSYDSIIATKEYKNGKKVVVLDSYYWDYSRTTSKYRNEFLGETTKETQSKIDAKIYKLKNLN